MSLYSIFYKIYSNLFFKKRFYRFHLVLHNLSLNGLGVLNCSDQFSGEEYFIKNHFIKKNEGKVIFDVGANVGNYSRMVRKYLPNADIYAFEPHINNFEKLKDVKKEHSINIINYACGDINTKQYLFDFAHHDGSTGASLYSNVIEELFNSESVKHEIEIIKIDDFAMANNIDKINLLKIDTEGHEMKVLLGAEKLIHDNKIDYIQLEFNSLHAYSRVFFKDIYDYLYNIYNIYRLLPDGMIQIKKYDPIRHEIFAYQNILAIRKDCTDKN